MGAERAIFIADELLGNVAERQLAKAAGVRLSEEAAEHLGAGLVKRGAAEAGLMAAGTQAAKTAGTDAAANMLEKGAAKEAETSLLKVNKRAFLGGGDEGNVFSNGDGSVTKVFHSLERDVHAERAMYGELDQMGVKVPKILEVGKTAEGQPAMRIQQIGDGDNLQTQLLLGDVPRTEMPSLLSQYDGMAKTIQNNGVRVDWQLKNMRWQDGELYVLDPSYLKRDQALSDVMIQHMRPR